MYPPKLEAIINLFESLPEVERRETLLVADDPKFLLQLPDQGRFRRFVHLDLAAGEFPQAGHRPAGRPLRDQHAPIRVDEGASGDQDEFDAHDPTSMLANPALRRLQGRG